MPQRDWESLFLRRDGMANHGRTTNHRCFLDLVASQIRLSGYLSTGHHENTHRFAVDLPHRVFKTPSYPSWIYSRYPFHTSKHPILALQKMRFSMNYCTDTLHSIGWWHSMCFDSLMLTSVISSSIGRGAPQLLLYWLDLRSLGLEMETCWNSTLTMQQMSCQSIFGTCFV